MKKGVEWYQRGEKLRISDKGPQMWGNPVGLHFWQRWWSILSPPHWRVMSHGTQAPSVGDAVIAGAISGMFSATMTYPFGTRHPFSNCAQFCPFERFLMLLNGALACQTLEIVKTRLHFDVLDPTNIAARQEPRIGEVIHRIWSEGIQRPRFGSPLLGGALGFYRGLDQLIPEAALKVRRSVEASQASSSFLLPFALQNPSLLALFLTFARKVHITCWGCY